MAFISGPKETFFSPVPESGWQNARPLSGAKSFLLLFGPFIVMLLLVTYSNAKDKEFRIHLPKRTKPTPVQKYNQDGVDALKKHKVSQAKKLFYKAYLIDPDDPFTLNNLGYIAELEGDVDRAQRFYELASENATDATIAKSTVNEVKGHPASEVAGKTDGGPMQVNRLNVAAMSYLQKGRPIEAENILNRALQLQPSNPFTLNNLGYTMEQEGELEKALSFYQRAANSNSKDRVIVTAHKSWRGKPIRDIAENNAKKIRNVLQRGLSPEEQVAMLNLRGVAALNRNERTVALDAFKKANKIDPNNAFALNNMGYVAELQGDRETAEFYYTQAQQADGSGRRIALATKRDYEGRPLVAVADVNDTLVQAQMQAQAQEKRREGAPAVLRRRDNSVIHEPAAPPVATNTEPALPESSEPNTSGEAAASGMPQGEPESQQAQPAQPSSLAEAAAAATGRQQTSQAPAATQPQTATSPQLPNQQQKQQPPQPQTPRSEFDVLPPPDPPQR